MKNVILFTIALFFCSASLFATKFNVTTPGFNFSPADINIHQGDTVVFDVGAIHTATEVSFAVYNVNGTTSNGGFNFGPGSDQELTNLSVGVHYYVCQNHAGMGMKGTITVSPLTDVKTKIANSPLLKVYPDPAKDYVMYDAKELDIKRITITSIDGKISKDIIPGKNTKISISDLPANVYVLSVYTKKDDIYIQEFAKE